jgi:hypothetical protein
MNNDDYNKNIFNPKYSTYTIPEYINIKKISNFDKLKKVRQIKKIEY